MNSLYIFQQIKLFKYKNTRLNSNNHVMTIKIVNVFNLIMFSS